MKKLGKKQVEVSSIGMGTWAIGGPFSYKGIHANGWGKVDDKESIKAINTAYENGVTFFDTATTYGCGHSEYILGKALKGKNDVIIASKFGYPISEKEKNYWVEDFNVDMLEFQLNETLRRLDRDYIDLYQLHIADLDIEKAHLLFERLEDFVKMGKIGSYGWSTDSLDKVKSIKKFENCLTIQNKLNLFEHNKELQDYLEKNSLLSINRSPLAMGILTGKYNQNSQLAQNDVRKNSNSWNKNINNKNNFDKLSALRELLTVGNRTLTQGALGWIMGVHKNTLPIPGIRTVEQALENSKAIELGALPENIINEINKLINY